MSNLLSDMQFRILYSSYFMEDGSIVNVDYGPDGVVVSSLHQSLDYDPRCLPVIKDCRP